MHYILIHIQCCSQALPTSRSVGRGTQSLDLFRTQSFQKKFENACMMANIFDKVESVRIRISAPLEVLTGAFEVIVYHIL